MAPSEHPDTAPVLQREVIPPGAGSSGASVIIVAAATMFFAIAGAAFALQARMSSPCPYEKQEPTRVRVAQEPADCGRVVVVRRGQSTVVVHRPDCDSH